MQAAKAEAQIARPVDPPQNGWGGLIVQYCTCRLGRGGHTEPVLQHLLSLGGFRGRRFATNVWGNREHGLSHGGPSYGITRRPGKRRIGRPP